MRPKWLATTRLHAGFFVLVIYALAWPALATELTYCANISAYMDCENNAACCGPDLSSATTGANLADTAVDGSVTTDTNGGTMYACQYTGDTAPTAAQIVAGSAPCVSAKTKASVTAGAVAFNSAGSNRFDGLTASTSYRAAYVQQDGTGRPILEVITTAPYETLAGVAPGGGDLTNSGHFVGCGAGASDSNDGLSHATRWASVAKVNNNVTAVGTNVYFQTDCVFEDVQFNLDWNGASDDLVEIDTYCIDTSDSNKPKGWTSGGTGCGEKAEINGTFDSCADTDPITCDVGTYNGSQAGFSPVPSGIYAGLVDLGDGRQYVHLRNLKVHDSAGRGVDMRDAEYIVIEGLDIQRTAFMGIISERGSRYVVVKNNYLDRTNAGEEAEDTGRLPGNWIVQGNMGAASQPSCIKLCVNNHLHGWDAYCGAWGNLIKNCAGEAIGISANRKIWVEQNVHYDTGASFYTDHTKNSYILRNLAAGSGNGAQVNQSGYTAAAEGTAVNRGEGQGNENQLWAWNISVGTSLGISIRNVGTENVTQGFDVSATFWHNTAIRPINTAVVVGQSGGTAAITADLDFRANAIWPASASLACRKDNAIGTFNYQSWSGTAPSDSDCVGANDTTAALTWPHTASEYANITEAQAVSTWTLADYKPTGANENVAPVIAVPAWATTDLASSEWDWLRAYDGEGYFMWGAAGCVVNVAAASIMTGADCAGLDASPDIGAVQ